MKKLWLAAALFMNAAVAGGAYGSSVTVSWTATGDDGDVGTAAAYDLRYATHQLTQSNWSTATQVSSVPDPLPAGSVQSATIDGLADDQTYYFAIRAVDEAGNWSALSNNASWSHCSCVGLSGNVSGDPFDDVNIQDLTDLVAALFLGAPSVPCPAEANLDGDPEGKLTIADLDVMVAYLFGSPNGNVVTPAPCP